MTSPERTDAILLLHYLNGSFLKAKGELDLLELVDGTVERRRALKDHLWGVFREAKTLRDQFSPDDNQKLMEILNRRGYLLEMLN